MAVVVAVIMTWEILVQCRREDSEAMKAMNLLSSILVSGCYEMTIAWHYMKGEYCEYWLISESYCLGVDGLRPWGNESLRYVVVSEVPLAVFLLGHYNKLRSTWWKNHKTKFMPYKLKRRSFEGMDPKSQKSRVNFKKLKFNFRNFKIRVLQRVPTRKKCSLQGSNLRPQGYEPCVLTIYTKEAP